MSDREAAEKWVDEREEHNVTLDYRKKCMECGSAEKDTTDAHLAGQECGEQRVTKRIMRWLQLDGTIWTADNAADAIIEGIMTEVWRGYDGEDE